MSAQRKFIQSLSKNDINYALKCIWEKLAELEPASVSIKEAVDQVEDIDALREEAKSLNIKSWHVMGAEKLKAAIETAKSNEGAD